MMLWLPRWDIAVPVQILVLRARSHPQAHVNQLGKSRGHPGVQGPPAQLCPSASPRAPALPAPAPTCIPPWRLF